MQPRVRCRSEIECYVERNHAAQAAVRHSPNRQILSWPAGKDRSAYAPKFRLPRSSSLARPSGSILICESLSDPLRTSPQIDNGPDHRTLLLDRIKDPVGKNPAEQAMVIAVDHSMDSCRYPQALDVLPEAGRKVIAESGLLCLIKEVSIIQVFQGILGDLNISHRLPMVPLTESQSKRRALPSRTRARRWSRRAFCSWGISMRSKRSRKSSQIASIIRIFSSTGNAFSSSVVMIRLYDAPGGQATRFLDRH